jgi:hypothetical protein
MAMADAKQLSSHHVSVTSATAIDELVFDLVSRKHTPVC